MQIRHTELLQLQLGSRCVPKPMWQYSGSPTTAFGSDRCCLLTDLGYTRTMDDVLECVLSLGKTVSPPGISRRPLQLITMAFSGGIWVSSSAILPLCMTKLCPYELQVPVLTSKSLYGSSYAVTALH